ncbi:MAG: dienelactone hydrolase family protein [bacterium]
MRPDKPDKKKGLARRLARMMPRPRRIVLLGILLLAVTSCVRARTAGLRPPGAPTYAYAEKSILLAGGEPDAPIEGYLIRPDAPGKFPCAVILHGKGGWWRAYIRYARALAERGIASLILNYYSAHQVDMEGLNVPFPLRRRQFELQNGDISRAAAAFARRPFCAGGKVGLIGFSMGADKAIRAAAERPEVSAVVGYYGPYDYVSFIRHRVSRVLLAIAPKDALRWKSYLEKKSPLFLADKVRASVLLFHGAEDRTIPVRQSVRMIEALRKNGAAGAEMKLYEGVGHNFVLRHHRRDAERGDSLRRTIAFLKKNLPKRPGSRAGRHDPEQPDFRAAARPIRRANDP